ncbi:hypothetical protein [Nocardioides jensenii]|uniref:hypothetical protein n=1 Tax=Nocardioides jensenii TaxID=1843 RepID=UPI000AAF9AEA|nr:hypothetical protein [Nocardioides jensenii]
MGFFDTLVRRSSTAGPEAKGPLDDGVRLGLPPQFEAVGEALASGSGSAQACEVAGRMLARDGASLDEALDRLGRTSIAVTGEEPCFDDVRALSMAWSESTLAYLHQLSCEDPLTGLASLAHIRSRLSELYRGQLGRGAAGLDETHALVVMQLPEGGSGSDADQFTGAMRLSRLGETARTVFNGTETIGRSGTNRVVVIVERDARLGRRVALVRTLLGTADHPTRIWIEGLPSTDDAAASLLDELCRT